MASDIMNMMNKRVLHHQLVRLRRIPQWLLLGLALFFAVVSVFALRANNQKMVELRQAVYEADEQNGDVEGALRKLREHVHAHMNTNLTAGDNSIYPPLQLKYTYERLVLAEMEKQNISNETLYTDAQNYCEQAIPTGLYGRNRLDCIREYVDSHGAQPQQPVTVPDSLYKFDFVSPRWSPDLAGWSIVLMTLFGALFLARLGSEQLIRWQLKKHQ